MLGLMSEVTRILSAIEEGDPQAAEQLLSLNDALDDLAREDPRNAELVKRRYFAGLSVQEAADVLGISRPTADRWWAYAKVWLYCAVSGEGPPEGR
jgi:RNA polymerase sigma factor (sigma-70 family)